MKSLLLNIYEQASRCLLLSLIFIFISCNVENNIANTTASIKSDSISLWVNLSKDKSIAVNDRKKKLHKAYNYTKAIKNDSLKNAGLLKIAYAAYKLNDTSFFKKINRKASALSLKLRDTFGLADSHWNFGNFFSNSEVFDSAYYHYHKARTNFEIINHDYYAGKMLYNMAIVRGKVNDYIGSEVLIFEAISKFKPLDKYLNLYRCYNQLGIIYNELQEYNQSIYYHNKALDYLSRVKNKKFYKEESLNNLSLVYEKQGDHTKAIAYLNTALENKNLKHNNGHLYAMLIDNLAYNRFLNGDTTDLPKEFYRSLQIRDSLDIISGIIINNIHLAEFYLASNDTLQAFKHGFEAYQLSKTIQNNRDRLASLLLLSKISKTSANIYLNEHITLSNELQKQERKIQNKFTRIQFETDEFKQETKQLSEQKEWIIILGTLGILILCLLYYIKIQQTRTKKLIFEKEQQKSNEEIYTLMLKQQVKLEEGRILERNRISEELHDGILGKLFGVRISLGLLDIKAGENTMKEYESKIDEIGQIESEIRTISHLLKNEVISLELSFIEIINDLVESKCKTANYDYTIDSSDAIYWNEINEKIKINIYRIIQEALQNIVKHSKASKVDISFTNFNQLLKLTIEDNGIGFETKKNTNGIGLKNMQSRTEKIKGKLYLTSNLKKGTKIEIHVPIDTVF